MRLICDANIGTIIANALTAEGHDVVRAIHVVPHADDMVVLAYAVAEDRVLVTCDSDFGEHVFLRGAEAPPAIIYIRFEPDHVADILPRLIPLLDLASLRDHMTVIGDRRDRRSPFPVKSGTHG